MNLKLGFANVVAYAIIAVMFWMWARAVRGLVWVSLAFVLYTWFVLPWIKKREADSYGDKGSPS